METVAAGGVTDPSPEEARRLAQEILEQQRYQEPRIPRPLEGPLRRLAELLEGPGNLVRGWFEAVADRVPGGEAMVWAILAALVVLVAAIFSVRVARRRIRRIQSHPGRARQARLDPVQLEQEARAAEERGDLEAAIRLRFRAGLVRLHSVGAIEYTPALRNGELVQSVKSPTLSRVARAFDEVAYGRRRANHEDIELSKSGWPLALQEAQQT